MSKAAVAARTHQAAEATDHQLVSAVRRGDDRAFETLYSRYERRITAYVYRMVNDHGRAEDITQEVFVAALRQMRRTERPIAFKPWIYQIARNACINAYRRGRRAEEVSLHAADRLSPADHGHLVDSGAEPDVAAVAKQDLDHLCGAFGGLSEAYHRILVMRELEGRSYEDIGAHMGLSRPAVASTLFRARKRLEEEYDELASGARCLRIQAIIADAGGAHLGIGDRRTLVRHMSHCQPCRALAAHAGLDVPVPARRRIGGRIAAWLPLPAFLRLRRAGEESAASTGGAGRWMSHVPAFADSVNTGWGKAGAGLVALLAAGAGVGVTVTPGGEQREQRGAVDRAPQVERAVSSGAPDPKPSAGRSATGDGRPAGDDSAGRGVRRVGGVRRGGARTSPASGGQRAGSGPESRPGGAVPAGGDDHGAPRDGGGANGGGGRVDRPTPRPPGPAKDLPKVEVPGLPAVDVPAIGGQPVQEAADGVADTVETIGDTVDEVTDTVDDAVPEPRGAAPEVTGAVDNVVGGTGAVVGGAVDDASATAGGLLGP